MNLRFLVPLFALSVTLAGAQDLPVTRVVLFTSGVGYFEHRGTVSGDAQVSLSFTDDQVNDVLKSLILRDPTGSVGVVGYPSQDPLDRSLRSFSLDLGGPGGLEALLPQLRGSALRLSTPTDVVGQLVGIDRRPAGDKTETWLTLATVDGLKVLPLSSVSGVKILDPKLEQSVSQALALIADSRNQRQKSITAQFRGAGARTVSLGYIAEAPVWKTSYRLDLSGTLPYLQAWAIVENTTDTDWSNVKLSLVSGRPVSFIQDLYTPLYVERPVYVPETEAGPAPRVNRAGAAPAMASAPAPAPMAKAALDMAYGEEDAAPAAETSLRESGLRPQTSGSAAGELFQFTVSTPVNLPRHRSALIPLLGTDVTASKVSLYNPNVDRIHPQNAVQITNSTGLRLPAGPVTLYDGGMYAGDAVTDSLAEKDHRLWTYATDLAVRAEVNDTGDQTTTKISLVKGVLQSRKDLTWTTTYRFTNVGSETKNLLVEHPYRSERTLVAPTTVAERTDELWRLPISAPAGQSVELAVKESQTIVETQGLAGWRADQILVLVQSSGPLSAGVKAALSKLADLRVQVDRSTQAVSDSERKKADLEADQARIRTNLAAVGRDSAQGQSYLKKMAESDSAIDQATSELAANRKALTAAQKALDDGLRTFSAE